MWEIDDDKPQTGLFTPVTNLPFLAPFTETKVKLESKYVRKIQNEKEVQNMLHESEVTLEGGYLIGAWNNVYQFGQSFFRQYIYGENHSAENADEQRESDPSSNVATAVADEQSGKEKQPDGSKLDKVLVQTLLLRYIMTYHHHVYQALDDVSTEIRMKRESENEKLLTIVPRADVSKREFDAAVDKFIEFYQKQSEKMYTENKSVSAPVDMRVITATSSEFSLIIDVSEESKTKKSKLSIYGEKNNVQKALGQLVKTKIGQLNDVPPRPVTTTANVLQNVRFSCPLPNNVNVVVYQGDLVEENVDVIVNPANESLDHCGGAAQAIAKAGGKAIQKQSNEIMRKRGRKLVAGEVEVTVAGNLPCKFIVHAVGPRRNEHSQKSAENALFTAAMDSLSIASKNGAKSISIPAISSGVFGIAVDFCACVLFNAVEAFAKEKHKVKDLHEIRFVNIDKSTTDVFKQEMSKRYSTKLQKETSLGNSPPSAGDTSNRKTRSDAERQNAALSALGKFYRTTMYEKPEQI